MDLSVWCSIDGFCPLDNGNAGVAPEFTEQFKRWREGTAISELPELDHHLGTCLKCRKFQNTIRAASS